MSHAEIRSTCNFTWTRHMGMHHIASGNGADNLVEPPPGRANVESEDEPFGRWQRGEPDDYAWHQDWAKFVRQATAAGVQFQRVRLASIPHSDYIRWGLDVSRSTSRQARTSATSRVT